jgi:hypothetical protein
MRRVVFVDSRIVPDVSANITVQSLDPLTDAALLKLSTPLVEIAGATENRPEGVLLQLMLKARVSDSPGPAEMLVAQVAL